METVNTEAMNTADANVAEANYEQLLAENQRLKEERERKARNRKRLIILLVILLLIGGGTAAWYFTRDTIDPNQTQGQLPYKTQAEIQAELNRRISESALAMSINTKPTFANGTAKGKLCIENSPANHYDIKVTIRRDDTGDVIFKSGKIQPNNYIYEAKLSEALPAGVYKATATFTAYNRETGAEKGQSAVEMEITIEN